MGRDSLKGPASEYIAGELRAQRARINMTIEQLVEASGVKRGTVMRTLSGDAAIAVDVLIPVALALGVDPGALLNDVSASRLVHDWVHAQPSAGGETGSH